MKPEVNFRRQILGAVVMPPLLLCLFSVATVAIVVRLNALLESVGREDRVITRATATSRLLQDREKALDGYVISGSPGSLGPYLKANAKINPALDDLARLVADDHEQSRVLALIRKQAERWAGYADEVAGGKAGPSARTVDPERAARGHELMNGVRIFMAAFLDTETGRRDRLSGEARTLSGSILPGCAGGGAILVFFLACSSGRRLLRLSTSFDDLQDQSGQRERERLGLLSEAMRLYAIFTLDPEGRIASWNQDSERILGYRPNDVLGRNHSYLFEEDDLRRDMPQKSLMWAVQEGRAEDVRWITRKDGFRFQARVALVAIRDSAGTLCGFTNVIRELEDGDA